MIQPGKYEAKIVNYDITENKKGEPQVAILFEFHDRDGSRREYTWYGGLTHEKGREITLKALLTCGFTGKNVADLSGGIQGGQAHLDIATPVEIDIQDRTYEGKTFTEIKWINRLGGGKWIKPMEKDKVRGRLAALNLDGELAALRAKEGQPAKPQLVQKAAGQDFADYDDSGDLPF